MDTVHAPGAMVLLTRLAKVVYRRSDEDALGMRLRWCTRQGRTCR